MKSRHSSTVMEVLLTFRPWKAVVAYHAVKRHGTGNFEITDWCARRRPPSDAIPEKIIMPFAMLPCELITSCPLKNDIQSITAIMPIEMDITDKQFRADPGDVFIMPKQDNRQAHFASSPFSVTLQDYRDCRLMNHKPTPFKKGSATIPFRSQTAP